MEPTRINKFLTEANYCSRRQADKLIIEGRVKINDRQAKLGDKVTEDDIVIVDGSQVAVPNKAKTYIMLNKPVGIICTTDETAPDNIVQFIDFPERIYPVGRLDVESSGMIILTNDGSIVNKILRAEHQIEKEYVVEVAEEITTEQIKMLQKGIELDDGKTKPCKVKKISPKKFAIVITEGRNRIIRRMVEAIGQQVVRLARVRIGKLQLSNMKVGMYRKLSDEEVQMLTENPQAE